MRSLNWLGLTEVLCVGAAIACVAVGALNSTGTHVNGLIQKVCSSLSTVGGGGPYVPPTAPVRPPSSAVPPAAETYEPIVENGFQLAGTERVSTFSIDVDTASYATVRRYLTSGSMPPPDAVRVEELVNYFPYRYPAPDEGEPLTIHAEMAGCPWNRDTRLVRIGLTARQADWTRRPRANLVFLVDVSGSMADANRLPLVKESLALLVEKLGEADRVSIVTYAGYSEIALRPTPGDRHADIRAAIERLGAGGSTNGSGGIVEAYRLARETFIHGGINRVVLATDGDFNVGVTGREQLVELVRREARHGVELTILGYGMGNYRDGQLEAIAAGGNGNYAYVDRESEARKVLVEQVAGTLWTVARDVKIQVEMNPDAVASWRQIGYENRAMAAADFRNDAKDACELGAGHTVTALYEIVPVRGTKEATPLTVRARFKEPGASRARELAFPVVDRGIPFEKASGEMQFASAVAAFGQLLRRSPHRGSLTWAGVEAIARPHAHVDRHRVELLELVRRAAEIP